MPISVWGYLKEYEQEKKEILQAVNEVFSSGQLILGSKVTAFEQEFSEFCTTKFGTGVDNGTNAIMLALKAVGVQTGDEVITVSNTAVPTVSAIVSAGAIPIFVDIDPSTYLMDVTQIEQAITKRTRCILPVHLYGQCVDMDSVNAIAQKYGIHVVEDCAQAHGARYKNNVAGSMSDASSFSFYPTKILGAYGDGGMVLTSQQSVQNKLRRLRFYGMESAYYALEHGYNSRLDEVQAAILQKKLQHINEYITKRKMLAARYDDYFSNLDLATPQINDTNSHAYYAYVVRHPKRDIILEKLKEKEIFVNISYPWPIHTMPAYSHFGYKKGDFPNTELAAKEIFSLPIYPTLSLEEQDIVCDHLKSILSSI